MREIYSRVRPGFQARPGSGAVFLDRDGVVVVDTGYLCRVEEMRLIEGAAEAIGKLNRAGIPTVMVSNQSGIGRGYYTWSEFEAVQKALEVELDRAGAWMDGVWACASRDDEHTHRKPNPGMLLDAARDMGVDLARSWMLGDKESDVEAGLRAGVRSAIRVGVGEPSETKNVTFCRDLGVAADLILRSASEKSCEKC